MCDVICDVGFLNNKPVLTKFMTLCTDTKNGVSTQGYLIQDP